MPDIDLRPPDVTVNTWPGQVRTVTVTGFPAGYLDDREHEWRLSRAGRSAVSTTVPATAGATDLEAELEVPDRTGEWTFTLFEVTDELGEPRVMILLDVERTGSEEQTDVSIEVSVDTGDLVFDLDVTLAGGAGVPDGGTTGQVLTKLSNTDGDADWEDATGGPPGGPAGGVLGGTYPDPSFAVDMATQAELNTEAADRAAADALLIPLAQKGAANGVTPLGADSLIPSVYLPPLAIGEVFTVASQAAMLALTAQRGDVAVRTDTNQRFILSTDSPGTLADWLVVADTDAVLTVNGKTGPTVSLVVADISDAAPLMSPALTGNPTAPTPTAGDDDTSIATTEFVTDAVATGVTEANDYTDDEIVALPQYGNGTEITYDDTTTPGSIIPVLGGGIPRVLNIPTPSGGVSSTSAATTLLSGTFTPPANMAAAGDHLVFEAWGTVLNSASTDPTWTLRLRYAGANLLAFGPVTMTLDATGPRGWNMRVLVPLGSTGGGSMGSPNGTIQVGPALNTAANLISRSLFGTGVTGINFGAWGAFDLTIQHSVNVATMQTICYGMSLRRHRAP